MKGAAFMFIAIVFAILAVSGCVSAPAGPTPATTPVPQQGRPHDVIGVDSAFPPFTYRDTTGDLTGFDVEAARWVADRKGFDVEFVEVPWDTIIIGLDTGSIDMIWSGMSVTPQREHEVNFTTPYYSANASVAVRSGSNATMQDLYAGRLRVGTQAGSTSAAWIDDHLVQPGTMPAENLVFFPDIRALNKGLVNGTVDATVNDALQQEQATAGKTLAIIGSIPSNDRYAVAVRKSDPQLQATVDDGLRQLMNDPYWQQLEKKYGLAGESGSP
jgi:polar amino acid transport system substrate-binding protein